MIEKAGEATDGGRPPLPKSERRRLAAAAHHLKPELAVGRDGLSESFLVSLREAFNTKELLKVRLLDTSEEDRRSLAGKLDALPDVFLIQNIGRTFILYKKQEDAEK
jgi:RNA-binding protein